MTSKPRKARLITAQHTLPVATSSVSPVDADPVIPSINAYGTFDPSGHALGPPTPPTGKRSPSRASHTSDHSGRSVHQPLLPSVQRPAEGTKVFQDLIPFAGVYASVMKVFQRKRVNDSLPNVAVPSSVILHTFFAHCLLIQQPDPYSPELLRRKWKKDPVNFNLGFKFRPTVACGGENLPLGILRCLSEWFSVLEDRGTVPGKYLFPFL
jgi:putative membrane protein